MDELLKQLEERIRYIAAQVFEERTAALGCGDRDDWLSYAQIVDLTGLSEWTIGEAVRRGELEADYPLPRCPRVKRSKLREWMERNSTGRAGDAENVPSRRRA